jgi:hypothetical protein
VRFVAVLALCLLALLFASGSANAARKSITGKLSKPNYTVIALASGGQATVVGARHARFKIRPPVRTVTLQLRGPNGTYAGPVVVGRAEGRAIVGVRSGTRVGRIRVRRGYAKVRKRLGEQALATRYTARTKHGVPIGARRFGRVRSRSIGEGAPGDRDLDGIPNVLDVDDDGDRILDRVDRRTSGRARVADSHEQFSFFSALTLQLSDTVNANAAGLTTEQVDEALSRNMTLLLPVLPGDRVPNSPELDCGGSIQEPPRPEGLIYCRPHSSGGIGRLGFEEFPDCCDLDEDGLGTLTADTGPLGQPKTAVALSPNATTQQIATGDLMIQRVIRNGLEVAFLGALQYIIGTVPALVSYDDGRGHAAAITYPYPQGEQGPGHRGNGIPVAAGPNGDVVVTLTFWRPQRRPVAAWGETGDWIDIGRLAYNVMVEESGRFCPERAFSERDPELDLRPHQFRAGVSDLAGDRQSSRGNTFTFTLNLTRCLESNGFSFDPGEHRAFNFIAENVSAVSPNSVDQAQQGIWFKRQ